MLHLCYARGVRIASSSMARSRRFSSMPASAAPPSISTAPPFVPPTAPPPRPRRRALAADGPTLASSRRALRERDARSGARRDAALAEATASLPTLAEAVTSRGLPPLARRAVTTLQLNVGKLCNLACRHCHVDSSPQRTAENMAPATVERILELLSRPHHLACVDLTGGAPELHPSFRRLVRAARDNGLAVIDRCNLSVLETPGQETTAAFLAEQGVRIIASLPSPAELRTDRQRGAGAHAASLRVLRALNALGYGAAGGALQLDLIHNPEGPSLPPPQGELEAEFRAALRGEHGIEFSRLLTLTNMPVARFADDLARTRALQPYMHLLAAAFNPDTLHGLMCRETLSVGWDGRLADCDFNLQLRRPLGVFGGGDASAAPETIWHIESFAADSVSGSPISTGPHCFGCTAGAGSSCGGALT